MLKILIAIFCVYVVFSLVLRLAVKLVMHRVKKEIGLLEKDLMEMGKEMTPEDEIVIEEFKRQLKELE